MDKCGSTSVWLLTECSDLFKLQCVFVYVCMHPMNKKENPSIKRVWHVFFLCVLSAVSDLFLPHQIFSVKTDIWNWEIHSTAPRCTLKRSAFTKGDCATSRVRRKTEFLLNRLVGCAIDACFVLTWFGRSLPRCCAELSCCLLCWSVLLDAVISSVHGQITVCSILSGGGLQDGEMAGGGDRGRDGGGLICCYIRKITFLLMYPSGRLLYLVVCPVFLFVYKPHEILVDIH